MVSIVPTRVYEASSVLILENEAPLYDSAVGVLRMENVLRGWVW